MKTLIWIFIIIILIVVGVMFTTDKPTKESDIIENNNMAFQIKSDAFEDGGSIPSKYTCDGENLNPSFEISGVPKEAQSLVLIMDDPDIPESVKQSRGIEVFDHWVVFNIPSSTTEIKEGSVPPGIVGLNSAGDNKYTGPCPPDREHRYFFKLYALNVSKLPTFETPPTKENIEEAMEDYILEKTELMGRYERSQD